MLSIEMLTERSGNFTASENHKLMAGWDKPEPHRCFESYGQLHKIMSEMESKPLVGDVRHKVTGECSGRMINWVWSAIQYDKPSQGLITYAEEKAVETRFDPDPSTNFSTIHTRNGEEREAECMTMLSDRAEVEFSCIGDDQVHIHNNGVGCTPDGILFDELDLIKTGAEAKCKSPAIHAKNMLINNNEDMKKAAFDHFVQVQTGMLVAEVDHWYFANFNPFGKSEEDRFKFIIVNRDDEFIKKLNERIELAKKIKAEFLNKYIEAVSKNKAED